jgi:hypothetical protein
LLELTPAPRLAPYRPYPQMVWAVRITSNINNMPSGVIVGWEIHSVMTLKARLQTAVWECVGAMQQFSTWNHAGHHASTAKPYLKDAGRHTAPGCLGACACTVPEYVLARVKASTFQFLFEVSIIYSIGKRRWAAVFCGSYLERI